MRCWTLRMYTAAEIAPQPDYEEMLTDLVDPGHIYFRTPCRELMAIWHTPFYLRLMLAAWKHVREGSFYARYHAAKTPCTDD